MNLTRLGGGLRPGAEPGVYIASVSEDLVALEILRYIPDTANPESGEENWAGLVWVWFLSGQSPVRMFREVIKDIQEEAKEDIFRNGLHQTVH
ncbi:unnamed protein product [Lota lota]